MYSKENPKYFHFPVSGFLFWSVNNIISTF
jgi:hypothetical protein